MSVTDSCYGYVYRGKGIWDEMKNEADRGISLYIGNDSGIKSCEKRDGCFGLNNILVL
jgi:hypothetical protein